MSEVTIYGASDDCVEFEGAINDEFYAHGPWVGRLVAPDGDELIVRAEFCKPGTDAEWTLSVENSGTWPSWPIRFTERPDRDSDPAIVIDIPDGTRIVEVSR
ncbi:hypothetical protein [Rhodococcus sp. UNC363MFTsu5.1]|uniref:hypothetical protein n=1 Tax=Rhodococcus sp. UNC363MFTsu5.1 TaxID=1449069 RepID=UPI00068CF5B0|nr:hypothetical protein [Rhodococcus sp. UNC363MFTsu5.1]